MNNTFSINRFGKLLAMDGKKYLRNFGITVAILCSLNVGTWLMTMVFGFTMPTFIRWMVIYVAVFLSCILVPAKAFGDINLPREGVRYAMLPVSNLEKYLSYLLYCVMTPVVVALVSYGIDSMLTLIPVGGFQKFIESLGFTGLTMDFVMDLGGDPGDVDPFGLMDKIGHGEGWNYIVGLLFTTGFFMMGNLLFKTHKTGKSFGIMMGFSYIVSTLLQMVMFSPKFFSLMANQNFDSLADLGSTYGNLMIVSIIVNALLTIALYVGIFFKLKTQKY